MKTTKELARELGLLRKRSSSVTGASHTHGKCQNVQPFMFLIVIDFESTCWEEGKFRTNEIIEFPAVLLNVQTGEIESVFHHYVQPQEHPTLSNFCTKLTGISQDQVEAGIPINLCLRKFSHWLDKLEREKCVVCVGTVSQQPVNTTYVTWSDWDLGVCLQYECKRKQLLKPAQLNSWIDLRATYRKFYDRKPNGLNGALQDLGIEFEGREHSGVDDAKNTAKLAHRMIKDGCILKVTKTLKAHERSASSSTAITTYFKAPGNVTPQNKQLSSGAKQTKQTCGKQSNVNHSSPPRVVGRASMSPRIRLSTSTQVKQCTTTGYVQVSTDLCSVKKPLTVSSRTDMESPNLQIESAQTDVGDLKYSNNCLYTNDSLAKTNSPSLNNVSDNKTKQKHQNNSTEPNVSAKAGNVQKISTFQNKHKLEKSGKRKQFTPMKERIGIVWSPCRKSLRKNSPKKLTVQDIYVDLDVKKSVGYNSNIQSHSGPVTCKGLKEQNMNIVANCPNKNKAEEIISSGKDHKVTIQIVKPTSKDLSGSCQTNRCKISDEVKSCIITNNYKCLTSSKPAHQQLFTEPNNITPISGSRSHHISCTKLPSSNHSLRTPEQSGKGTCKPSLSSGFKVLGTNLSRSNVFTSSGHSSSNNSSTMKITPPLCKCGRRSKRRMVQSPGQNMGRFFFSCPVRPRVGAKEGCDFFKWEESHEFQKKTRSSVVTSQFTPVVRGTATQSNQQRRSLGVRSAVNSRTYLR